MKEIKNCWECENCYVKSKDPYIGYHLCKLIKNTNVEKYSNSVYRYCPLLKENIEDDKVFDIFSEMVNDFKNDGLAYEIKRYFYKDGLEITVSIKEEINKIGETNE